MTVRFLNHGDVEAYQGLRLLSLKESPFAFSDSLEDEPGKTDDDYLAEIIQHGNPPERFTIGAFAEDGGLTGFVGFVRDLRTKARHRAMVRALYVVPQYRGRGIARKMLLQLLHTAEMIPNLE